MAEISARDSIVERPPAVGVSVLLRRGGAILLVQRCRAPYAGLWALPGGHVRRGETLAAAVVRALGEETGVHAAVGDQLETIEIIRREGEAVASHHILVVFAADWVAGDPVAADDAAAAGWFTAADWPSLALTPETARLLALHAAPAGAATVGGSDA